MFRFTVSLTIVAIGACLGLASTAAAARAACPTTNAQYATSFERQDDSWENNGHDKMGGGMMVMAPSTDRTDTYFYNGDTFKSGTICADIRMTTTRGKEPRSGIAFWKTDDKNYYFFIFDPVTHRSSVWRKKDDKLLIVVDWRALSGVGRDIHALYEFTVRVDGTHAVAAVNGHNAGSFDGRQIDGPCNAGLRAEAADNAPSRYEVASFTVLP